MKRWKRLALKALNRLDPLIHTKKIGDLRLKRYWSIIEGRLEHLFYRSGAGRSDARMAYQVLTRQDYALGRGAHARAMQAYAKSKAGKPLIIDAGGNIGASTFYFLKKFPEAFFYVIEPEPSNCNMILINHPDRPNLKLFRGAIGSNSRTAFLERRSDCGHRIAAHGNETIEVIDTLTILAEMEAKDAYPFIYKIDIEGSEHDLFSGDVSWMDKFPCIVIELHDWMLPFSGNSSNFLQAIGKMEWDVIPRGENLFFFNRRLLSGYNDG